MIGGALLLATGAAACSTDLESEGGCPLLCPDQQVNVQQINIDPVLLDTTVQGFPLRGEENALLVAREGTTLDTRAIYRFDAVPRRFQPLGQDSVDITELVDAYLRVRLDTTNSSYPAGTMLEVYDVDGDGADDDLTPLIGRFVPARLLGSVTIPAPLTADTIRIPLVESRILAAIRGPGRVRLGVRASTPSGRALVRLAPIDVALGVDPSPDENVGPLLATPSSLTPTTDDRVRRSLTSFVLVAAGASPLPSATLGVGGLPARRTLIRFTIPRAILDSATIVRATLVLTQRPVPGTSLGDSVTLTPLPVKASDAVTDVVQSILLAGNPSAGGLDTRLIETLRLSPADSGERAIELQSLLLFWQTDTPNRPQRALVLQVSSEGLAPEELRFFSSEAPAALRPRLRITYIPRFNLGLP